MIFTRFGFISSWPAHKNLPIFKKCFFNLLSLKTGSKIISLLWILLFSILFAVELRTALNENSEEQLKIRCLFNQTGTLCSHDAGVEPAGIFLYGYYNFVVNQTQGSVTSVTRIDDGLYEWSIFCTCLLYTILILFSVLLYWGIMANKSPVILTWLGVTQMILAVEVCMVTYDFVFLVKSEHYNEYLSYLFLLHLGFVAFISYSLLIINSYVVACVNSVTTNSMLG